MTSCKCDFSNWSLVNRLEAPKFECDYHKFQREQSEALKKENKRLVQDLDNKTADLYQTIEAYSTALKALHAETDLIKTAHEDLIKRHYALRQDLLRLLEVHK